MAPPLNPSQLQAFRHFRKRISERYGLEKISVSEYLALKQFVENGHKRYFVGRVSNTKSWWLIEIKGVEVLALYCRSVRGFLSCLPMQVFYRALEGKAHRQKYLGLTPGSVQFIEHTKRVNATRLEPLVLSGLNPLDDIEETVVKVSWFNRLKRWWHDRIEKLSNH